MRGCIAGKKAKTLARTTPHNGPRLWYKIKRSKALDAAMQMLVPERNLLNGKSKQFPDDNGAIDSRLCASRPVISLVFVHLQRASYFPVQNRRL